MLKQTLAMWGAVVLGASGCPEPPTDDVEDPPRVEPADPEPDYLEPDAYTPQPSPEPDDWEWGNPPPPDGWDPDWGSWSPPDFSDVEPLVPPLTREVTSGPCVEACVGGDTWPASGRCQACQCKQAMDGWLPSAEQLQCENGVEVQIFDRSGDDLVAHGDGDRCANPSLFSLDCPTQARLGELRNGDVMVRWLCRTSELSEGLYDEHGVYDFAGIIAQNTRTGATCFWDAWPQVASDDNLPDLDISAADDATIASFAEKVGNLSGEGCVMCHDADPFIYTPYVGAGGWESAGAEKLPYGLVQPSGLVAATGMNHLVEPEVAACTACHRLADGLSCGVLALDAMGEEKSAPYDQNSLLGPFATWMPHDADTMGPSAWEDSFGAARDKILECCGAGGPSGTCAWEPIPAW